MGVTRSTSRAVHAASRDRRAARPRNPMPAKRCRGRMAARAGVRGDGFGQNDLRPGRGRSQHQRPQAGRDRPASHQRGVAREE